MYIDAHSHLDFFEENIEDAIVDINKNEILTLAMSMDIESYTKNKEYSNKSKYIKPCFGIHPWSAHKVDENLEANIPYIEESEIIGEIGLDYVWAEEEVYNALKEYNYNKAIVHWYSGDLDILDKYIELGCYFTISVDIGYSDATYKILDKLPNERLLVETDGPTALKWVNSQYGYPSIIKSVVKKISDYKNIDVDELSKIIESNYNRLLSL